MLKVYIELIDQDAKIIVVQPIRFFVGYNEFAIPQDFVSDGMSVPKFLWRLICPCLDARTVKAAIKHDYLYQTKLLTRLQADNLLFGDMIGNGFPLFKSFLVWLGVRLFGRSHYV